MDYGKESGILGGCGDLEEIEVALRAHDARLLRELAGRCYPDEQKVIWLNAVAKSIEEGRL